jgi:hypothetical protein
MLGASLGKFALVSALALLQTTTTKPNPAIQRRFSAEDAGVKNPAPLPDAAFVALANDDASKVDGDDGAPMKPARDWYSAAKLSPPATGVELYMVEARPPLIGANVCRFWLVRYESHAHSARVIWSSATHDFGLRYRHGSGYPEIETFGASAVHVWEATFRYRGGKYVVAHQDDYDIGSPGHR